MIQTLSTRFRRPVAALLYLVFYVPGIVPLYSLANRTVVRCSYSSYTPATKPFALPTAVRNERKVGLLATSPEKVKTAPRFIGGPASPEASSFKAAGADNLVNLFTGDFSYSVPLLDVGGYPVNMFYNGGISMEQEASWVGLGWNINPGSVSRNMRGVPDDFNGTDTLIQIQNTKPNKTWGAEVGVDGELLGIKKPNLNFNIGYSYNNYLGPELELGAGVSVSIPITKTEVHEKSAPLDTSQGLSLSLGASAKLSSRSGLTLAPSLNAGLHSVSQKMDIGIGLSTSYNSRTGIKDLNISSQMSAYRSVMANKQYLPMYKTFSTDLSSTTISFARPSYIPTLRMPMQYTNYSGQVELGGGMFGLRGAITAQGYSSVSKVADGSTTLRKFLVGYMYLEKAAGRKDVVMDFNRVNDGEVTPHTPVLSAPQYDYDVFSIQGEGTGGAIRAYRSDMGFMRDNETNSKDNNISLGFDIAPPGHYGGNWNIVSAPTRSGSWDDGSNLLNQALQFDSLRYNSPFEHVYFRNPGETTITNDAMISKMGRDNLVRFKLDGSSVSPRLSPTLEQFSKKTGAQLGTLSLATANSSKPRDKRTQIITMLPASDAARVGLDTAIKSYSSALDAGNNLQYSNIPRVGSYRKAHHISEVTVLEGTGMRYVYGLPVYNIQQKDFTFSVKGLGDPTTNLVNFASDEPTTSSSSITGNTGIDGYTNIQQTPAYASSFLLTGLVSPDYVDVTGNGITEDDLGTAVKFDYTMSSGTHKWRTPRSSSASMAHFNIGLKTERRDNKATISYGEREAWYLHAIESKSMIAIFSTSVRQDAKGVADPLTGSIVAGENANLKLDSISLYTKSDLKARGLAGAVPLKTVHFDYSYTLCSGTPDNSSGGKLTLTDIYFTFNGQSRSSKNMYVFNYGDVTHKTDNPLYSYNASDRWGTYKPITDSAGTAVNPGGLSNIDYPYTSPNKAADDVFAGSWGLKKILLPSGGQMEVTYEADDYAYVQDRRACNMFRLYGLGNSTSYSQNSLLYQGSLDQNYIYVQLPSPLQNTDPVKIKQEIFSKYLDGLKQLAFKLNIYMPKGLEALTVYANWDDYGVCANSTDRSIIYLKLSPVSNKGPLANASVHFLIENLPGQAFPGYDMSDDTGIGAFLDMVASALGSISKAFTNAENQVRGDGKGSIVALASSFVRLASPTFFKYGGGHRVKRVVMKDNWSTMSGQYTSTYGQDYDYTTTTNLNGVITTISSGVASYEPGIGSEENPFREILQYEDKLPLASAQYGAIEMPILEGLYPSPMVGYSKVTVRSIHRNGTHNDSVVRSGIGKQVTEFYTAKDYPSFSTYTPMNNLDYRHNPPFTFFYKETIDRRTSSQGFLVETNDMHGKMKSQASYSEKDENTPLSYTLHMYKNTGAHGLNDLVDFVHNDQSGTVTSGNMGIDMELMTDVREFSVISNGTNGQAQVDFFNFVPWPVFGVFIYPLESYTENKYRAVTTTKLINYHAIEDSVISIDKGSSVTSKTIAYDGETGNALISQTTNEFNDPIYTTSYPAYWAYSSIAPAYKNIGMRFSNIAFSGGKIVGGPIDQTLLESGDELYIESGSGSITCVPESPSVSKVWVFDTNKNTTALTVPAASRNLVVLDSAGNPFTKNNVIFRILRSGHRNVLMQPVSSATSMANPIQNISGTRKLLLNSASKAISSTATLFREKWQTDPDLVPKTSFSLVNCVYVENLDCNGTLQKHINPYVKGLVGNYKPFRSFVYYGSLQETDPSVNTTIRKNGYLAGFGSFWNFDGNSNLTPDTTNVKWIWNSELTKMNSKGQEIETKDALNRYTAAQYGFEKNLALSVTQNARNGQAFGESFEDYSYSESLNKVVYNTCSSNRYINFSGLANSSIINTDALTFSAHSGKYALQVNGNSQATLPLNLRTNYVDDYLLAINPDTAKVLNSAGGNVSGITFMNYAGSSFPDPTSYVTTNTSFGNGGFGSNIPPGGLDPSTHVYNHTINVNYSYYIVVPSNGTYNVGLNATMSLRSTDDAPVGTYNYGVAILMTIKDLNNNTVANFSTPSPTPPGSANAGICVLNTTVSLCAGIYQVSGAFGDAYFCFNQTPKNETGCNFSASIGSGLACYKSLTTASGCIFSDPIPGKDSMFNAGFALQPGAKMQFSGWVREDCGNAVGTPCYTTNYKNNHVALQFTGGTSSTITLRPSGVIVEGWQKIDTSFIVPTGTTGANLVLANDSTRNVYFDDLRIHPFNADMKSYIYDPRTLHLMAELDENNFAVFYDYDEEGQLIRVKRETIQGIKTIKETRNAKQKNIKTVL